MKVASLFRIASGSFLVAVLSLSLAAPAALAQSSPEGEPAAALADALLAACRQDAPQFAAHLTDQNAKAYLALPPVQRAALLRRLVLLDDPGKPLLSGDGQGHSVIRCEAGGVASEMRLGGVEAHDNLAFIQVTIPQAAGTQPGEEGQSARFGLVREGGKWKLLSLGLLLLDVPALAEQWKQQELEAREKQAAQSLVKVSEALIAYREAYGRLPEMLSEMGPPSVEEQGKSPEKAGLLDAGLAGGEDGGYRFRYSILAKAGGLGESPQNMYDGYQLAATPIEYGKGGKRSFYLDSGGALRGADKHGAVATRDDPVIGDAQQ